MTRSLGILIPLQTMIFSAATRFLTTIQDKLNPLREDPPAAHHRIDDIRQAMLRSLSPEMTGRFPHLEQRILTAASVPALWFLRPELLMALAAHAGEEAAHRMVDEITCLFEGLLPSGLSSRPSRLQRQPG